MEVTDHISGDDHVQYSLTEAYQYLSTFHKEFISLQSNMLKKFPDNKDYYVELKKEIGLLITFCRCTFMWIFNEDGEINQILLDLVVDIGAQFDKLIEGFNTQLSCGESNKRDWYLFSDAVSEMYVAGYYMEVHMFDDKIEMKRRIAAAYHESSFCICCELVNYDMIKELLDQLLEDLDWFDQAEFKSIKKKFTGLINYVAFVAKSRIFDDNLVNLLVSLQLLARDMAKYCFVVKTCEGMYDYDIKGIHSSISMQVFNVLALKLDGPGGAPRITEELLIAYVEYVQEMMSELLEHEGNINLTISMKIQLRIIHDALPFLSHLITRYPPKQAAKKKRVSDARLHLQNLARDVGLYICSCLNNPNKGNAETLEEEMSPGICDLMDKLYGVKNEIIMTIRCLVLERAWRESPKTDQLYFFIHLLKILKKLMTQKQNSGMTWNEHENLVLFIFYIQNSVDVGSGNTDQVLDYYKQDKHMEILTKKLNNFQMGVDRINHEALSELLISAQVAAFKMACSSLLARNGNWWELYLVTKERATSHMRVGILTALMLSSTTTSLSDEQLSVCVDCVQDSLVALQKDEDFALLKDHSKILSEGLLCLWRLLVSYINDEQKKLSHIKRNIQDLLRSVVSVVFPLFDNRVKGDMVTKQGIDLSNLVEKLNLIKVETKEFLHLVNLNKIGRESPKTDWLGSLNLLLENWNGLMDCETDLIFTWKDQLQTIYGALVVFKSFITRNADGDDESQNLCKRIMHAAYVAEYLLASFSVGKRPFGCSPLWISEFMENVELIKAAALEVSDEKSSGKEEPTQPSQVSSQDVLGRTVPEVVVGFEEEMELIRKRLGGHLKQLDVISITGMPGLGKTTLARRIYEDPSTVSYFDARAWCCISQEYNKKDLILTILDSIVTLTGEIRKKTGAELSEMVHKQLKGRRYFIVVDDVWEINAFMGLKTFFPDDKNGSRIMLTSRSKQIGLEANGRGDPIEPGMLSDKESWGLLERKVYNNGKCPSKFCQIGKEISQKCRGLPLAVVVVGGVIANSSQKRDIWEQVASDLSSYLARDPQSQVKASLELSYKFLPDCLKSMFLYLGAFPEDKEINVDNLMWLWIAEGFVQKKKNAMSLEIQAEIHLAELINRSLIMVARRKWDGRVKTCYVHDLLRDMCLAKAKEEKFMQQVQANKELPDPIMYQRRLHVCVTDNNETLLRHFVAHQDLPMFSITPPIYSFLYHEQCWLPTIKLKSVFSEMKLLRVLQAHIIHIESEESYNDLMTLICLRYLSISVTLDSVPSSISTLRSLEILIINGMDSIIVPETIWEMTKLRHLHINHNANFRVSPENPFVLDNLQTLSTPYISHGDEEKLFKKVPCLKKLRCIFKYSNQSTIRFRFLDKLESLKVGYRYRTRLTCPFELPHALKKLSISMFCLKWSEISMLRELPNLEVLKLGTGAVHDECWDMEEDDVFTNLKILKLVRLGIKRWNTSSVNFPSLEKLVFDKCWELEEIPSALGDIDTLQKIEVIMCMSSVVEMAKDIQKEQEVLGNEFLKVHIQ